MATRLKRLLRRIVETEAGPMTVLLRPAANGRSAVVEVRVKRGRKVLSRLEVRHPSQPLEQLTMFGAGTRGTQSSEASEPAPGLELTEGEVHADEDADRPL